MKMKKIMRKIKRMMVGKMFRESNDGSEDVSDGDERNDGD